VTRPRSAPRGKPFGRAARPADLVVDQVAGWNPVFELLRHDPGRVRAVHLGPGDETPRVQALREVTARLSIPLHDEARGPAAGPGDADERVSARIVPWQPRPFDAWREGLVLDDAPLVLALDGVTDQGNLGAVLRSAEFFGVAGVLLPHDRSASLTPTTLRASQGALLFLNVVPVPNLVRALSDLKALGFQVVGTALDTRDTFADVPRDRPTVLVLGAEDRGMRRMVREACDVRVRVRGRGRTQSLNVSAFAALALHALAAPAPEEG